MWWQAVNENHHIIKLLWNGVKLQFNYLPAIKVLKETDEIIISCGPSLSTSINRAIIPALECPDIQRMEVQIWLSVR